jgi:phage shock protein A
MASDYQIMVMITDLNRKVHDHEALSRQYNDKANKAITQGERDKLKNEARDHIKSAEKLKEQIKDLKKQLEKQKQVESPQIQKWGKVGQEAASISKEAAQIRQQEQIQRMRGHEGHTK